MKSFWLLIAGLSFAALAGYGYASWSFTFLIRVHGLGFGEAATGIALATVAGGAVGTYAGGALADRLCPRDVRWYGWIPAVTVALSAPAALPFLFLEDPIAGLFSYVPFLFLGAMYASPTWAAVQTVAPARMRATATSLLMLIGNVVGLGAGPLVVGAANDILAPTLGDEAVRYTLLALLVAYLASAVAYAAAARALPGDLGDLGTAARSHL